MLAAPDLGAGFQMFLSYTVIKSMSPSGSDNAKQTRPCFYHAFKMVWAKNKQSLLKLHQQDQDLETDAQTVLSGQGIRDISVDVLVQLQ